MGFQRFLTVERLHAVAAKAVEHGCQVEIWRDSGKPRRLIRWDVSGGCEAPLFLELHARYSAQHGKRVKPLCVILETQCRDCGWCRNQRRKMWAAKAMQEFGASARTWFLTLTLEPAWQARFKYEAIAALQKKGVIFEELSEASKFAALVQYGGGREVTRFIKRVRENSRHAPIRYLLVAEAHASGMPHFHMLVHERSAEAAVPKRVLQECWRVGFSKVVLSHDARAASYLCKYLAKDARTRVRSSFGYGGSLAEITNKSLSQRSTLNDSVRAPF